MSQENPTPADDEPISLESEDEPLVVETAPTEEDEPLGLIEEGEMSIKPQRMRAFGSGISPLDENKIEFKRPVNMDGTGATRCRIFHAKITDSSLEHMESQINSWLDSNEIEVKHVGHTIGVMEGKRSEPNMLVMVWY